MGSPLTWACDGGRRARAAARRVGGGAGAGGGEGHFGHAQGQCAGLDSQGTCTRNHLSGNALLVRKTKGARRPLRCGRWACRCRASSAACALLELPRAGQQRTLQVVAVVEVHPHLPVPACCAFDNDLADFPRVPIRAELDRHTAADNNAFCIGQLRRGRGSSCSSRRRRRARTLESRIQVAQASAVE
jgi:hypothetical protein